MKAAYFSLLIILGIMVTSASGAMADKKNEARELPPDSIVISHNKPPKLVHEEKPEYPRLAREGGFGGKLTIKSFVDENGAVVKAKVVACNRPNLGFEESALRAEFGCRYDPAQMKDGPVGVWIKYEIVYDSEKGIKRGPLHSHNL